MKEELYWRKFAFSYKFAEKVCFVRNLYDDVRRAVAHDYPDKDIRILDVGCGSGANTIHFAQQGYQRVVGLDPGESVLQIAEDKLRDAGDLDNCKFCVADITKRTEFDDGYFDVILSTHVFQKIEEYDAGLQEIRRLLKPAGTFYITIPSSTEKFSTWLWNYMKEKGIIRALWDIRWLLAWTSPYVLLTRKEDRKNENRWDISTMEDIVVRKNGFKKKIITALPYFHVGCTFGVFEKK